MFGQNGAMQQFFDENLAAYVDVNAQKWNAKPGSEGSSMRARSAHLKMPV